MLLKSKDDIGPQLSALNELLRRRLSTAPVIPHVPPDPASPLFLRRESARRDCSEHVRDDDEAILALG